MILAYVNEGRWVAECACRYAVATGTIGDMRDAPAISPVNPDVLSCPNCGTTQPISYPPSREEIARHLALRPEPVNRNWRSETIADLRIENALYIKES